VRPSRMAVGEWGPALGRCWCGCRCNGQRGCPGTSGAQPAKSTARGQGIRRHTPRLHRPDASHPVIPLGAFDPDNPPAVTQLRDYRDQAREWGTRFIPAAAEGWQYDHRGTLSSLAMREPGSSCSSKRSATSCTGPGSRRAGTCGSRQSHRRTLRTLLIGLSASQDLDNERIIGAILSQPDAQLIATHRGAGRQRPGAGSRGARTKARTTAGRKPGIG